MKLGTNALRQHPCLINPVVSGKAVPQTMGVWAVTQIPVAALTPLGQVGFELIIG